MRLNLFKDFKDYSLLVSLLLMIIIAICSIVLCVEHFGLKGFLILFLWQWSNNIYNNLFKKNK